MRLSSSPAGCASGTLRRPCRRSYVEQRGRVRDTFREQYHHAARAHPSAPAAEASRPGPTVSRRVIWIARTCDRAADGGAGARAAGDQSAAVRPDPARELHQRRLPGAPPGLRLLPRPWLHGLEAVERVFRPRSLQRARPARPPRPVREAARHVSHSAAWRLVHGRRRRSISGRRRRPCWRPGCGRCGRT